MVESIGHAVIFGLSGFVWATLLCRKGEVLEWWPMLVRWIFRMSEDINSYNIFQHFIFKTAYGCSKCVAGQLAIWYLILVRDSGPFISVLATVMGAVFFAWILENKL